MDMIMVMITSMRIERTSLSPDDDDHLWGNNGCPVMGIMVCFVAFFLFFLSPVFDSSSSSFFIKEFIKIFFIKEFKKIARFFYSIKNFFPTAFGAKSVAEIISLDNNFP